ncbi:60S acidic ribosomal protein P2 [Halotydeus destructor]|nr:60S acidic ribosomal protein P2 [Halotydeus destructor]
MRYVAAYLLALLGGTKSPSAKDIENILKSVGIEVDAARSEKVISELKGKKIEEVIASGSTKLASVPSGGGAAAPAAAAPAAAAAAPAAAGKKEAKKEESEEEDDDMGFGLFD